VVPEGERLRLGDAYPKTNLDHSPAGESLAEAVRELELEENQCFLRSVERLHDILGDSLAFTDGFSEYRKILRQANRAGHPCRTDDQKRRSGRPAVAGLAGLAGVGRRGGAQTARRGGE